MSGGRVGSVRPGPSSAVTITAATPAAASGTAAVAVPSGCGTKAAERRHALHAGDPDLVDGALGELTHAMHLQGRRSSPSTSWPPAPRGCFGDRDRLGVLALDVGDQVSGDAGDSQRQRSEAGGGAQQHAPAPERRAGAALGAWEARRPSA